MFIEMTFFNEKCFGLVDIGQGCWRKIWHLAEEKKCGAPLWHCPWDVFLL
jgi:hypothetical protein